MTFPTCVLDVTGLKHLPVEQPKVLPGFCRGFLQLLEANSGILSYDIILLWFASTHFPITALLAAALFKATYVK